MYLSSFADDSVKERYINFGRALLWELDYTDHLITLGHGASELEIMKSIKIIFYLVASLCFREWQRDQSSLRPIPEVTGASLDNTVPSIQDPVYQPEPRPRSRPVDNSVDVGNFLDHLHHVPDVETGHLSDNHSVSPIASHNIMGDASISAFQPVSMSPPLHQNIEMGTHTTQQNDIDERLPRSQYVHENGKHIFPDAWIKETADGCHVPFELLVQPYREDGIFGIFDNVICKVRVSFPDNTHCSYIPVQDIRVLNFRTMRDFTGEGKFKATARVEMSSKVYKTIINRLKHAYVTRFPGVAHVFLAETYVQNSMADSQVEINISVLDDCFARLLHLLWFEEHPFWEALKICENDVFGNGLLQAAFVESPEGTSIVLSLAGVVVERNLFNYDEMIFRLLGSGVVIDL